MKIPILILAAGASKRMQGRDKLVMDIDDKPLIHHVAKRAISTGHPVFIALSGAFPERKTALAGLDYQPVHVDHPEKGMSISLLSGLAEISPCPPALLVSLADMPDITTQDYLTLIDAFLSDPDAPILRCATHHGQAGNPVILPRWAYELTDLFQGDQGARALFHSFPDRVKLVPLSNNHAKTDLDTPQDWESWQASKRHQR